MRVCPDDAKCASTKSDSILSFTARNPGEWGNRIKVTVSPVSRVKTQVYEVEGNSATVRSVDGFNIGDVVEFADGKTSVYNRITAIEEKTISFENPAPLRIPSAPPSSTRTLYPRSSSNPAR